MVVAYEALRELYLSWVNDYISVEAFARDNHLEVEHAKELIDLGRKVYERGSIWE